MNDLQTYIAKSRYARWRDDLGRRENYTETVERYINFFAERIPAKERKVISEEIRQGMLNLETMPSMRALMTAGKALDRDNAAGYNCSYLTVDDVRAFDEAMYLSMCGVGVGFSVERQYINKLPILPEEFYQVNTTIEVKDSKIGWASGLRQLISLLYAGQIPKWDLGKLRPKGAILKTFGGRSSGPEPLDRLFRFLVKIFTNPDAAGRKLTSIECHDIMCMIADCVVSGGVRRSAMISLSNLSDERMRQAKNGQWYITSPQRARANNSVAYTEKPDVEIFMKEFTTLVESKSGERGIYNRAGAKKHIARFGRRKIDFDFGVNPCVEILLRAFGFCNLSEVVIRPGDTFEDIKRKIRVAVIIGCLQSTLTDFRYLRKIWKTNAEEERLLGVSLTGICDNPLFSTNSEKLQKKLVEFREYAVEVATEWAEKLGINVSVAITCVKPSGTVSQLVKSGSGIHPWYAEYYIRAIREDAKNPIAEFLKSQGVPWEIDATNSEVIVFYFPVEAPKNVKTRKDFTAISQLELWLTYKKNWTEHNPSCTIYVKNEEWIDVMAWCWKNFDEISGLSFMPYSDHIYKQAPYTEITKEEYDKLAKAFPKIDWNKLTEFEKEDTTTGSQESACAGGLCEI